LQGQRVVRAVHDGLVPLESNAADVTQAREARTRTRQLARAVASTASRGPSRTSRSYFDWAPSSQPKYCHNTTHAPAVASQRPASAAGAPSTQRGDLAHLCRQRRVAVQRRSDLRHVHHNGLDAVASALDLRHDSRHLVAVGRVCDAPADGVTQPLTAATATR
jgi:hypothetical protein